MYLVVRLTRPEIHFRLWNPQVHYRFQKSPLPFSILIHMSPVHGPPPPKSITLRTILMLYSHLRLGLPSGLFLSGLFPTKILYAFLACLARATFPTNLIFLHLFNVIVCAQERLMRSAYPACLVFIPRTYNETNRYSTYSSTGIASL
jgi:hypothetical protein